MAARALRGTPPTTTDSGWPTTPNAILLPDLASASTTILNDTLVVWGFEFSLPTTAINVVGIEVRIDGSKFETPGTHEGTLYFIVELNWGGGGGGAWTSPKKGPKLLTSSGHFFYGSPTDLWGHAWIASELAAGTFRVRITTQQGNAIGSPEWRAEFVTVAVFHEDAATVTEAPSEPLTLFETVSVSRIAVLVRETLALNDSGSVPRIQNQAIPRNQQITLAGTALTNFETTSGYAASIVRPRRRECYGLLLSFSAIGPTLFIGDSTLASETGLPFLPGLMQPGLIAVDGLHQEGTFGEGNTYPVVEVRVANKVYEDQRNPSSGTKRIADHCSAKPIIGRRTILWSFVDSGDGWQAGVLLDGAVEDIEIRETEVIIRALQHGTAGHPVPDIFVDETLFTYEPGSSGVDTGEEVKGSRGRPVPIGLGRFDYGAVKKPTDFAVGHPFRMNRQSPAPSEANKVYAQIALFPSMFGLKHPMMPTVHAASRYRRINSESATLQFTSWPFQNVFLFGSRKSSPELRVMTGPTPTDRDNMRVPSLDWGAGFARNSKHNDTDYILSWTWHEDDTRSVGLPMVASRSDVHFTTGPPPPSWVFDHNSAGSMDRLGYPAPRGTPNWSDGSARDCYGIFVNSQTPRSEGIFPSIKSWPGCWQSIALPMAGPTGVERATRVFPHPNSTLTPIFRSTEGTGEGFVENLRNCMDLKDPENSTRVQNMAYLSLQMPIDGPNLGKMRAIRVCLLWNNSTSTAQNVYLLARLGPTEGYIVRQPSGVEFENLDFNSVRSTDIGITTLKLNSVANATFASMWVLPYWLVVKGQNVLVDPSEDKRRLARGEWNFTSMDYADFGRADFLEFPWDFMLHVRDLSGGSPIPNRFLDLVAVWMEVVFQSNLNASVPDSKTVGRFTPARHYVTTPPKWWLNDEFVRTVRGTPVFLERVQPSSPAAIYVTGKGAQDDASGSLTGSANAIIENPADIAGALIRHYLGTAVFDARAKGSTFGSFETARTLLGSFRLALVVSEAETVGAVLTRIAQQSTAAIAEQLGSTGRPQWRIFVDDPSPASNDPARIYRSAESFMFRFDHLAPGTLSVGMTPYEALSSNVRLRYGLHLPTRSWSDEKYCSPEGSNFATAASTYEAAMATVRLEHGVENPIAVDAPDVWDPAVAETLAKWHADKARRRYVIVEFETYVNGLDLVPGHVIRMDDEIGDRVAWPGSGATNWSVHYLNVVETSVRREAGQITRVRVRAVEVYTKAA